MQSLLRFAPAVASDGAIRAPMGRARFPLVDTRDVAAAVASLLGDSGKHAERPYISPPVPRTAENFCRR